MGKKDDRIAALEEEVERLRADLAWERANKTIISPPPIIAPQPPPWPWPGTIWSSGQPYQVQV